MSEARGSGSSKCLGQTMGTVCGGAGWGGVGGTVAPQQECAGLSGNVSTSFPSWPAPPQWPRAHPATRGSAEPGMAKEGTGRPGIPGFPLPASLSNPLGLGRMMGAGAWSFPMPLALWVALGKSLPPLRPQFPHVYEWSLMAL